MAFVALLDATCLFPATLRSVLLRAHDEGLYQLRFTDEILEEVRRSVLARYPDANIDRTISLIRAEFGDGLVTGYDALKAVMTNDEDDRHVLAAAVRASAQLIVTDNVRHFPVECRQPYNIDVQTGDEFLQNLWDLDDEIMTKVLEEEAASTSRPKLTVDGVLGRLEKAAPGFVALVRESRERS